MGEGEGWGGKRGATQDGAAEERGAFLPPSSAPHRLPPCTLVVPTLRARHTEAGGGLSPHPLSPRAG